MSVLQQSIGIIFAFAIVFVWQLLGLEELTIPFIGLLALLYLILSRRQNKTENKSGGSMDEMTIGILTTLVLLLITATGSLTSPIFFLLYFIPFAICFVLLPETAFVFLLGVILLFLPIAMQSNITENVIKLGSIALITPLAYFFGKEFRLVSEHEQKDEEIAKHISSEAANVLRDQSAKLPEADKAQLADIIEESEALKNVE